VIAQFTTPCDSSPRKKPADAWPALIALSMRRKLRQLYDGPLFRYRQQGQEFDYPENTPDENEDAFVVRIYDQKAYYGYKPFNAEQLRESLQPKLLKDDNGYYAYFKIGQYMDLHAPAGFTNIYAFGNSFTDIGNYPPDLFPARQKVWVEYIAEHNNLNISPSNDSGNNYAWGGARLLETYTQSNNIEIPSIKSQISSAPTFEEDDLICFFGGGNDYLGAGRDSSYILSGIEECLDEIVTKGGKNIVILNMINLYRMPGVTDPNATQLSQDINSGLNEIINNLSVNVYLVDAYSILENAFTNGIEGVDEELFFDDFHLIDDVHNLFAISASELIPSVNPASNVGKDFTITAIGDGSHPRPMIGIFGINQVSVEPGRKTNRFTFNDDFGSISKDSGNLVNQLFSGIDPSQNNERVITMKSDGAGEGHKLINDEGTTFDTVSIGRLRDRFFEGSFIEVTIHLGGLSKVASDQLWEEAKSVY